MVIGFFNLPNTSSPIIALESTQPLAKDLPGVKGRLARKDDNLTTIGEPIFQEMREPLSLTIQ
jgi:hypothetical protein